MEMMMNAVDGVFTIAEVVDTIAQFFQREDVQRFMNQSKRVAQASLMVTALVATVLFWFGWCGVKVIYRAWAMALPLATVAFQEGYAGIEAGETASEILAGSVDVVISVEPAVKPLSQQLRQQCKEAGIQWRNANGRNKHLTVGQMQAALAEAEC
jgi:hypothetical protein